MTDFFQELKQRYGGAPGPAAFSGRRVTESTIADAIRDDRFLPLTKAEDALFGQLVADATAYLTVAQGADRERVAGVVRVARMLRDHGRAQLSAAGASLVAQERPLPEAEVRRLVGLSRAGHFFQWRERLRAAK
jgi:hypothetical protein